MPETVLTVAAALLALTLLWLAWWLLIASEGVYLGRRVVVWLYDRFATRYDDTKNFQPVFEQALLAQPLLEELAGHRAPMVLDVATGTARLPLALLGHPGFQGRIVATDLSRGMLGIAAHKLCGQEQRCLLLRCPAHDLPFEDGSFDLVTCLEALEFMARPGRVLAELLRVLRPGGLLFISNRVNTRLMPGKTWNRQQLARLLQQSGAETMRREPWQIDYERIFARKRGTATPVGARPPAELLRCPVCARVGLDQREAGFWRCCNCSREFRAGDAYLDHQAWSRSR
ncbi:MAG: methyltransferase domain-containing protein [Anaerolineaceae bacterium]|nr:methyltransferase domain-containing protein [Anaerolineaceae bacterium]